MVNLLPEIISFFKVLSKNNSVKRKIEQALNTHGILCVTKLDLRSVESRHKGSKTYPSARYAQRTATNPETECRLGGARGWGVEGVMEVAAKRDKASSGK